MLYRLHNNIFIVGLLTLVFLILMSSGRAYSAITVFLLFAFITQVALLIWYSQGETNSYSEKELFIAVLLYSFFLGGIIISMSYFFYGGEKFLFEDPDAVFYYREGIRTQDLGFVENTKRIVTKFGFDDWGALLFSNIMLSIIPSFFFMNIFYLLIGAITTVLLFRIGKYFMPESYSFMAALAYSTSSYMMMFHCTFLKESLFVFLVVCVIYFFNKSIADGDHKALLAVFFFIILILFYRPPLIAFLLVALGTYYAITQRGKAVSVFLYGIIVVGLVVSMAFMQSQMDHYTEGGDTDELLAENGSQNYSGGFNYLVGWFVSFFGPFPTLFPLASLGPRNMNFYGAGLVYKLFMAFPLWIGVFYAVKRFNLNIIPLLVFTLVEMAATGFIMASFELRKVLLHVPFTYIIAYYGIYQLEKSKVGEFNKRLLEFVGYALTIGILFLWNVIRVKG